MVCGMWRNKLAHSYGVREVAGAGPAIPTMKVIAKEIQKKVKQLRRKGKSHRQIARILNIGLGTAFYYSCGVRLTKIQHQYLMNQSYKKGLGRLTYRDRLLASSKGGINNRINLKPKYSRDKLITLLKDFYTQHKRIPTKRDFMPMYGSFFRTFGTWNNAIRKAGFSPNPVLFAKKYIANDGHKCDSLAEKIIDDWLTARKIPHERNIQYFDTRFTADFKIGNTLVEFFGLHNQLKRYDFLMKKKLKMIKKHKLSLIPLYPEDVFPTVKLGEKIKFGYKI